MAMKSFRVPAGVDVQSTKLASHQSWNESNLIRFKDGHLQKLGGCQRLSNTALVGTCRGLHAFQDLGGVSYLAAGTDQRLQLLEIGQVTDITPLRKTSAGLSNPITTAINQTAVTVADSGHGAAVGDWINFPNPVSVGGLTLSGFYQVVAPVAANTYTILSPVPASSNATGGGTVSIQYLIGSAILSSSLGYGGGLYGTGNYGQGSASITAFTLRQWSLDNWGQDLIGCPTNGPPYLWTPPVSGGNVAVSITGTGVPLYLTGLFVAMPQRQVMGFGAESGGAQDPLLIRWCDVNDYTTWTATATNQAGSFRLSSGARIVGAMQTQSSALFWTDIELWQGQYLGFPLVWGFNKVGTGCGLIGMRAAAAMGGAVFWMGQSSFFLWNGSAVEPLPCSVWDFVFNNLDRAYADSVFAAPNSWFGEIAWYFPTIGSNSVPNAYVKFNTILRTWDYGSLTRLAWQDQSVLGAPIGIDASGMIQQHETANDLDGQPMDAWAETGWMDIADGTFAVFIERFLPDFLLSAGATCLVTIKVCDFVGDPPTVYGPFTVTAASPYFIPRCRGRFAAVRVESQDSGSFWRLGEMLYVTSPAGRRAG